MEIEKLGYIVYKGRINDLKGYVGLVDNIESADPTKPMLIVGLKEAKAYAGDNFSILNKRLSDNVFWTFKKTEKRVDFERDILLFYNFIINNIIDHIKYYYINLYNIKYNKFKLLYNIFLNNDHKYIFIKNNMCYFLFKDNIILGFSFKIADYMGISRKKAYLKLKSFKNVVINFDNSDLPREFSRDLSGKDYVIPYLMRKLL